MNNKGIKVLTGVVFAVVGTLLFTSNSSQKEDTASNEPVVNNIHQAIASGFNDNIRDVSARLLENEKRTERAERKNKDLMERIESLLAVKEKGGIVVREEIAPELKAHIEALQKELTEIKAQHQDKASPEMSEQSKEYALNSYASNTTPSHSIKDIDALLVERKLSENELHYWNELKKRKKSVSKRIKTLRPVVRQKKERHIPYYTVPAGSDLGHTVLLSALIGEVPIDGKLMQPLFPFSALVSRGDLMASNGVPLPPDISGMKVNGYAIGVGSFLDNISCVRAYVTSVLFTFQDGHFVVIGNEEIKNSAELVNNDSLGYLTTSFGNPCIHGKYFTNAPRVLAAMTLAGGTQSLGESVAQWQMTNVAGVYGGASVPTGSFGKFAGGQALAGGTVKAADWLEKRIQGSFDMVFIPASYKCKRGNSIYWCPNSVSLHLTKTLSIDKELQGRLIHYGNVQNYNHDFSLR